MMENLKPNTVSLPKKRLEWIDISKGMCIILVVMAHYRPENSPQWYVLFNEFIYSFRMPLFLFTSGFIYSVTKKDEKYIDFARKKIKRLLVPYFTVSILIITLKLFTQKSLLMENPVVPFAYIEMFYLPVAGYFLWFIWALFWMFLLIPFFKSVESRMILLALSFVLYYVPIHFPLVFCLEQFRVSLFYFVLGVFVHSCVKKWNFTIHRTYIVVAIIGFIGLTLFRILYWSDPLIRMVLGLLGIFIVSKIAIRMDKKQGKGKDFLILISSSSYIIYLFHTTFEGFAKSVLNKLEMNSHDFFTFLVGAVFVIFAGLFLPMLVEKQLLKKFKVLRFLFGLK